MRITEPYTIYPRKLKSGKIVYYYQFRDEYGRRSNPLSTGCDTKAKAMRFCQKLYNEGMMANNSNQLFRHFAKDFFAQEGKYKVYKEDRGQPVKKSTLDSYESCLNSMIIPFFADMRLDRITPATVSRWIQSIKDKYVPGSLNSGIRTINILFSYAVSNRLLHSNPAENIGYRKIERNEKDLLTIEEIKSIYNYKWRNEKYRLAFLIAVTTGMRINEICALMKENIHEDYFDVKYSWQKVYGLSDTKTHKSRYVPKPVDLKIECSNKFVISDNDDKPFTSEAIYHSFVRILKNLGIDREARGITFHSLRNFFISYMRGQSVPDIKLKAVVGHSDGSMTDWYTYWKPEMFNEIYEKQYELYQQIIGG